MSVFVAIDAGTRGVTCTLFDERGAQLTGGHWQAWTPVPGDPFGAIGPGAISTVDAVCEEARDANVLAVAVTSQRTGAVFLAEDGTPLLISPNRDGRGAMHGIAIEREHGDLIWSVTGHLPVMVQAVARLRALEESDPGKIVHSVLSLSDWIVSVLTGASVTEPTQAAETGLFDLAAGDWSDEVLAAVGVSRDLLPPVRATGTVAGEMRLERWGIPVGTPVLSAGADTQCAALGMGATGTGDATVVAGTTMLVGRVREEPAVDARGRLWTSPMPVPGRWISEAHCGESGALIDWIGGLLFPWGPGDAMQALSGPGDRAAALHDAMGDPAQRLARAADEGQPGAGGVLVVDPFPSAARDFVLLKRASLSFPAPVLALGRPRSDVARAVFEGIAFGARAGLGWLAEAHGEPDRVLVAGGVSRSGSFRAALAGSLERPITVARTTQTSGLGAAIVAAAGHHGGLDAAVEAMHDRGEVVPPDEADGYAAHHAGWEQIARRAHDEAARTGGIE